MSKNDIVIEMEDCGDQKLIENYFKGDEKSLEILIKRYLAPIYGFTHKYVNNAQEAEDITQDVFVKAWRNLKKPALCRICSSRGFDPKKGSFKTWVFSIAKNAVIDFLKKKKAIQFSDLENEKGENVIAEKFIDFSPLPEDILKRKDLIGAFAKAINKLMPKYRKILFLRHDDNLTFREISETTSESLNTVKSRHRRALIILKKFFPL